MTRLSQNPVRLEELNSTHEELFLGAMADFETLDPKTFAEHWQRPKPWSPIGFAALVKLAETERRDWRPKAGQLSVTRYILLDQEKLVGLGALRFPLSEELEAEGGNLVFSVPPSYRQQGYGALTLNRLLFESVRAGMARVLVTCPSDNAFYRRAIARNRGELESETNGRARYWIRLR